MAVKESIEEFKCTENPFRDFGARNPDQALAKSMLAMHIQDAIEARGISQREAGELMGIDQAKVSAIMHGKLKGFTMERLLRFLNALDLNVEIKVTRKPSRAKQAHTVVTGVAG